LQHVDEVVAAAAVILVVAIVKVRAVVLVVVSGSCSRKLYQTSKKVKVKNRCIPPLL